MKKTFYGGIAALSLVALLASGCAQETVESKNDKLIKFTPVVGKQTRATEFTDWTLGASINVHSFPMGSLLPFRSFLLTKTGSGPTSWEYGTAVPQPGVPLVFYSIYPDGIVDNVQLNGNTGSFNYVVPTDDEAQVDLLAAHVIEGNSFIGLPFEHVLSQVNFAIRGLEGIRYQVTNISLTGVADQGTYTFGGNWAVQGDEEFPYRSHNDEYITPGDTDDIFFLGNNPDYNGYDNALMLLPQTLGGVTLNFDYAIYDMANVVLRSGTNISVPLNGFGPSQWDMSMRYLYVIDFTGDDLLFDVIVGQWTDYGDLITVNS